MRYLLDSNILRHYLAQHQSLLHNIAKIQTQFIQIPFVVVAEQMRGRYDAILKAEAYNLLFAQQRLIITQGLLSHFEIAYLTNECLEEFIKLQAKKSTNKRYADFIIASMAIASDDVVVTRNVKDFKDLLPDSQIQNWIDDKY